MNEAPASEPTQTLHFDSHGLRCEGDLYLPEGATRPPVVVMGHGFGAERNFGTANTVRAFVELGCAVFLFDYRYFGGSEGNPRHYTHPERRCEDWHAALAFIRQRSDIDPFRIAIWGSSLGGGHALSVAAKEPALKAAIALVPHCDGRQAAKNMAPADGLKVMGHALWDRVLGIFGREHRIPLLAEPDGTTAAMNYDGWLRDYLKIAQHSTTWENALPARSLMTLMNYHPIDTADAIECAVLLISGEHDPGVPREDVQNTAARIKQCTHIEYPVGHFDLYDGFPCNRQAIEQQCLFLKELLF